MNRHDSVLPPRTPAAFSSDRDALVSEGQLGPANTPRRSADEQNRRTCEAAGMAPRFSADEWETLTLRQRIELCTAMAKEAQRLAQAAPSNPAVGYLALAEQWLRLAVELSAEAAHTFVKS